MTTITLWLLVSVGGYGRDQYVVIDRFPTATDCEHVRASLPTVDVTKAHARCIEAKVVR